MKESKENENPEIKKMDLNEFLDFGYLQEVNRQFFHPLGFTLEVIIDSETNKCISLGGIWDYRDNPEGMFYYDLSTEISKTKAFNICVEKNHKAVARKKKYGFIIQPIGHTFKSEGDKP